MLTARNRTWQQNRQHSPRGGGVWGAEKASWPDHTKAHLGRSINFWSFYIRGCWWISFSGRVVLGWVWVFKMNWWSRRRAKKSRQTRFGVKLSAFKCFFWVVWMSTNKAIKWFAQMRHKKLSAGKEKKKTIIWWRTRQNFWRKEKRKPPLTDCSCDRCCEDPWKSWYLL